VVDAAFQFCSSAARELEQSWHTASHTLHELTRSVAVVTDRRQRLGRLGERVAAEHLIRRGFRILECNYRTRWGELDIVACDGRTIAFVEVKSRRLIPGTGSPFESINPRKRHQVRRMAGSWLSERADRPIATDLRFDAIGVTFDQLERLVSLEHLEGAF
jgi:putative endonuclease